MDLAEIRKKARLQDASQTTEAEESRLVPPAPVEVEKVCPEVILEKFWDSEAGLAVTTEEDYAQDLPVYRPDREENEVQWLTFFLGKEEYALELSTVLELVRPRHLTELPQVPDYLLGIVSLRGVIVPVINLGQRLNLACCTDDSQQRIIVCASEEQRIGLLVDKVSQVVKVDREQVEPPPLILEASTRDFIAGIGRLQGRMLILLDPEKVLDIAPLETFI